MTCRPRFVSFLGFRAYPSHRAATRGGTGTLEEIAEVLSKVSLKHLSAPCILYNLDGYYNDLKALLHRMIEKGLSSEERQAGIYFAENLDEIKRIL